MGAQSIPRPITVEEYERIPDPPGGRYELHHGEVVFVTYPVWEHKDLQRRLRKLLEIMAEPLGFIVDTEYPYRPFPENEMWGADVACVSGPRYRVRKWLEGSPELVIEVKSPSNTRAEMHDKAMTTLAGAGAVEFWVFDAETRTVLVHTKSSGMRVYGADDSVPVPMFGSQIALAELFAGYSTLTGWKDSRWGRIYPAADFRGSCNIRDTACLRARLGMALPCLQDLTEPRPQGSGPPAEFCNSLFSPPRAPAGLKKSRAG